MVASKKAKEVAVVAVDAVATEEDVAVPAMSLMETTSKKDAPELKVVTDPEVAVAEEDLVPKEKKVKDVEDKEEAAPETRMLTREKAVKKVSNALKEEREDSKERPVKMLTPWTVKTELAVEREAETDKVVAVDNGAPLRMT